MTIEIKHRFNSSKPDGSDNTVVRPSDWNDTHSMAIAGGTLVGRAIAGQGAIQEITLTSNLEFNGTSLDLSLALQTFIVGKANKAGDDFTGRVNIQYGEPILRLTNAGVRAWDMQVAGSIFRVVDATGGYSHTEFEPGGNILFRSVPGGAVRLDTIIGRANAGEAARSLVDQKFENTRLTGSFSSDTNGAYDAPSGGVITGYTREAGSVGRVGSIRGKYLQSFSASRGWVGAYNEG